jgi:hypothetical protein
MSTTFNPPRFLSEEEASRADAPSAYHCQKHGRLLKGEVVRMTGHFANVFNNHEVRYCAKCWRDSLEPSRCTTPLEGE